MERKTKTNKIRYEKGDIITDATEIRGSLGNILKTILINWKIKEMDALLYTYDQPKFNQENTNNSNRSIMGTEIGTVKTEKKPFQQKAARTGQINC
jgi:hypothetical protein